MPELETDEQKRGLDMTRAVARLNGHEMPQFDSPGTGSAAGLAAEVMSAPRPAQAAPLWGSGTAGPLWGSGAAAPVFNDGYAAASRAISLLTETWAREAAPENEQ